MKSTNSSPVKAKSQGPIRWGGFLPLAILTGLAVAYFILFFDLHLKWGLQSALSAANGAKVDIGWLRTRIFQGELLIQKIEIGDPGEPMKNRAEVGNVRFKVRLLPLLQKKVVIQEGTIENIRYGTPRKRSAALPPSPPSKNSLTDRISTGFETVLKKKIGENEIDKIGSLLSGKNIDTQLIQIGEGSNSFQELKAAEAKLDSSAKELDAKVKSLPDEKQIDSLKKKVQQIGETKPKSPEDALRLINDLKTVQGDVSSMADRAKEVGDATSKTVNETTAAVQSVEKAVDKDVDYFKKKMNIPNLNLKDLTLPLLGPKLSRTIEQATKYAEVARKYMPAKKKGQKEPVVVQVRAKGRDFQFGRVATYPTFLLERATITSKLSEDVSQGDAKGEIIGVNTNPSVYGRPTTASLTANLPRAKVQDAKAEIVVDHVTEVNKESGALKVGSFPVEQWSLVDGSPFFLKVEQATGTGLMKIAFEDEKIELLIQSQLSKVVYAMAAEDERMKRVLERALKSFPSLNITARVAGTPDNLDVSLASDLGERLGQALRAEVQAQLDELNAKIRSQVTAAVDKKKKELLARFEDWKKKSLAPIEAKLKMVNDVKGQIDSNIDRLNKEKDQLLKGKAQEGLDNLKKNIKIPGF